MPITAERIVSILFDPQPMAPRPQKFEWLAKFFGQKAKNQQAPVPRLLSINEARVQLLHEGVTPHNVQIITYGVSSMMSEEIRNFVGEQAIKAGGMMIVNDVDWADTHYLGVAIQDPPMDFSKDEKFIARLRSDFKREITAWMESLSPGISEIPRIKQ